MKEKYITYAKNNFNNKTLELIIESIKLFYTQNTEKIINKYNIGDKVYLKKDTFIHGIPNEIKYFDWIIENGFISNDFTNTSKGKNKITNSIGMWKIKEDILLKDYINLYSGVTITSFIGRGPNATTTTKLIPYHKFDIETEMLNNDENIWSWKAEQTKEVRFLPSLVSKKIQIAFILNMDNELGKNILEKDLWTLKMDDDILKDFTDYRYTSKFIEERKNRNSLTTDREAAIIFGVPKTLIEGIIVGKELEKDKNKLEYIKNKLPNCYISSLEGIIIK